MTVADLQYDLEQSEAEYLAEEGARFGALLENDLHRLHRLDQAAAQYQALDHRARQADADFERCLTFQYAEWVKRAEGRLRQLEVQKANDCNPPAAPLFVRRLEEAREVLALRTRAASTRRARQAALAEED